MLLELAEKCEAATGADREIDRSIFVALGNQVPDDWNLQPASAYTASLDAAMQLVPEGYAWSLGNDNCAIVFQHGGYAAFMSPPDLAKPKAATPALALCAAALRARSTNPNTERQSL